MKHFEKHISINCLKINEIELTSLTEQYFKQTAVSGTVFEEIMLTASNYGRVCLKGPTTCSTIVKDLLYNQTPICGRGREAMQYGKDNEAIACKKLEEILGVKIKESGLIIDSDIPYLAASPDGIIDADMSQLKNVHSNLVMNVESTGNLYEVISGGIVEIKCPKSAEHLTIEDAVQKYSHLKAVFDRKNQNVLNIGHKYYMQIQGQLHHSRRSYCIFFMWSPQSNKIVVVMRDDHFWKTKMEPNLTAFYLDCLVPEIVDGRYKINMNIREPDYVLKAKQEVAMKKVAAAQKVQARKEADNAIIEQEFHQNCQQTAESVDTIDFYQNPFRDEETERNEENSAVFLNTLDSCQDSWTECEERQNNENDSGFCNTVEFY